MVSRGRARREKMCESFTPALPASRRSPLLLAPGHAHSVQNGLAGAPALNMPSPPQVGSKRGSGPAPSERSGRMVGLLALWVCEKGEDSGEGGPEVSFSHGKSSSNKLSGVDPVMSEKSEGFGMSRSIHDHGGGREDGKWWVHVP